MSVSIPPDGTAAARLARVLRAALGGPARIRVRAWDGSQADLAPDPVATVVLHRRRAVRAMLAAPGEVGLARAYVRGDVDLDGDLEQVLDELIAHRGQAHRPPLGDVARLWGLGLPPPPPAIEARLHGRRHSRSRDAAAIAHHYDVGNDFYRLLLGPSLTYSCAYWLPPAATLEQAQEAKHELIAAKLALAPGMRVLDIGCGWGSFLLHAASRYGVRGLGVTLSARQAELARQRIAAAGLEHLVEVRLQDYRDLSGEEYDAVASVGMAEHVGAEQFDGYARRLAALVRPGGRVLHHAIATRSRAPRRRRPTFIGRFIFPDGELLWLHRAVAALEGAGLEVRDVQALREHYPLTLRAWRANLREHRDEAVALAGEGRVRAWELYLLGSALAFERATIGVNQVLAVRLTADGRSGMPPGRPESAGPR